MEMKFSNDARKSIRAGVEKLTKAVSATLGPAGKNVIVHKGNKPHITKDGATVAEFVKLDDVFENVGANVVREVALKTAEVAGDGTTTSTVLAHRILVDGMKLVDLGHNVRELKAGIDMAVNEATTFIKNSAKSIESYDELLNIAKISANGDETIAKLAADAISEVGKDGIITVETGRGTEDTIDVVSGLEFSRGYMSPYFMTDQANEVSELENPVILLSNDKITKVQEILPILEASVKMARPLLIIASDVDNDALGTLVINQLRGNMRVCVVKTPGYGDRRMQYLDDISVVTGAKVLSKEVGNGFDKIKTEMLGSAEKVIVGKDKTLIVNGNGDETELKKKADEIQATMNSLPNGSEKDEMRLRWNRLVGGVAVIRLGAKTELEMMEKKDRVDDAVAAVRAVEEDGYVVGGGMCLFRASAALMEKSFENMSESTQQGYLALAMALAEPLQNILVNGGIDVDNVIDILRNRDDNAGYDVITKECVDMFASGIIDPAKVVYTALQNAASIAGLLLTTECVVPPEEKKEMPSMPMEMM